MCAIEPPLPAPNAPLPASQGSGGRWHGALAFALTLGLAVGLNWPLALHLSTARAPGAFHDGHVWCFRQMARMLVGLEPFSSVTADAGFPWAVDMRFIGWGAGLVAAPFQLLAGPVGAYNLSLLLVMPLGALVTGALFRRLGAAPGPAWAASVLFATTPFVLGTLASGQIEKGSTWVLPLCLVTAAALFRGDPLPLAGGPVGAWLQGVGPTWFRAIPWGRLALVLASTLLAAITSPDLCVVLPVAMGVFYLALARGRRDRAWGAVGLALSVATLGAAFLYYKSAGFPALGILPGFSPSGFGEKGSVLAQVDLKDLFVPVVRLPPAETVRDATLHSCYLPWTCTVGALLASVAARKNRRGVGLGWALVAAGLASTTVLGLTLLPKTSSGELPVNLLLRHLPVPGLMTYRYIWIAVLGLSFLVALGTTGRRFGSVLAWTLALATVCEGVWYTRMLWQRPLVPVPGLESLADMAADPEEGAVLVLPPANAAQLGGTHLLFAAFHHRPTPSMAAMATEDVPQRRFNTHLLKRAAALDWPFSARVLAEAGYRYVIWYNPGVGVARGDLLDRASMVDLMGPPRLEGTSFASWRLDEVDHPGWSGRKQGSKPAGESAVTP